MKQHDAKPLIIPVFIPHSGCPHQCVFCNQKVITGQGKAAVDTATLRRGIESYLGYDSPRRKEKQISFYGGTFLGLSEKRMAFYLEVAKDYVNSGKVHSLRCSTRPDTVSEKTMGMIRDASFKTIELGVQSMDDEVLAVSGRGHTAGDTEKAVALLQKEGYDVGLQMMVGLPGDTLERTLETGRRLAGLKPGFVRIYPTLVLRNSPLADLYLSGNYQPMRLDESVKQAALLYAFFDKKGIPVIRMGLQASEDLDSGEDILAGPYHPAFGHLVYSSLFLDRARKILEHNAVSGRSNVGFRVHPRDVSRLRGLKNGNIASLMREFDLGGIRVMEDSSLAPDTIRLESI